MHILLEAYLEQVAAHLSALPAKRRHEELREMRQHLLNAVTVNQELGQSEEDAAANAVMQFGTPEDLGNNLVWAWQRGENRLNKRSFWGAAVCACVFPLVLSVCVNVAAYYYLEQRHPSQPSLWAQPFGIVDLVRFFVCFLLPGSIIGIALPKNAVKAATLGTAAALALNLGLIYFIVLQQFHTLPSRMVFMDLIWDFGRVLLTALSAWICSCWQAKRTVRLQRARG